MKKTALELLCLSALLCALSGCVTINIYYPAESSRPASASSSSLLSVPEPEPSADDEDSTSGEDESSETSEPFEFDPTTPYDAVYGKAGDFGLEQELNTVTLKADGVVLKNKTIHRNVIITAKSGTVTLEDCKVEGKIRIIGGAGVVLKNVSSEHIEIRSDKAVSLVLKGSSRAVLTDIYSHCTLTESKLTGDGFVKVKTLSGENNVTINLNVVDTKIGELEVRESVTISLQGSGEIIKKTGGANIYYD